METVVSVTIANDDACADDILGLLAAAKCDLQCLSCFDHISGTLHICPECHRIICDECLADNGRCLDCDDPVYHGPIDDGGAH